MSGGWGWHTTPGHQHQPRPRLKRIQEIRGRVRGGRGGTRKKKRISPQEAAAGCWRRGKIVSFFSWLFFRCKSLFLLVWSPSRSRSCTSTYVIITRLVGSIWTELAQASIELLAGKDGGFSGFGSQLPSAVAGARRGRGDPAANASSRTALPWPGRIPFVALLLVIKQGCYSSGGNKKKGINLVSCTVKVGFSIMFKLCKV